MTSDDFSKKLEDLKINENNDINILLLGETGVGKSTFINSIANYLSFKSFKKASKTEDLLVLIPSVITVTDQNFQTVTLKIGSDNNEFQEIGAAGTQDVKTYVFPIGQGKTKLRLIDTPGMGDPRGVGQDDENCENILRYLSQLKELHAICFLLKPTLTRITVYFEYCVKQILSRLEKSASNNIIFIFTNTRGQNYTPGDTLPCLKTVIDDIKANPPHVEIPLKNNTFSLDNEAFRFLVAMKRGITFNDDVRQRFIESWDTSSKECWRMISYIVGDGSHDPLKPHQLYNTISINEARRIIVQLSQPLADISQLIHDNIRILDRHQHNLKIDNQSLDQLKQKLYIPVFKLKVVQLTQPVTVCTSPKCAEVVKVNEVQKWHYRQRCHDPCYLTTVTKEMVGDLNLIHCAAMSGKTCMKCTCDFSVHMHVYYLTTPVEDKIEDNVVKNNIKKKEDALAESQRLIREIDRRKAELEEERKVIIRSTAQFAHFLQHNAISPFNDSYKGYIEYLIQREKSLGRNGDPAVIHNLEQLLLQYEEIKDAFKQSHKLNQQLGLNAIVTSTVTAKSVMDTISQLYQLKHNGKKIHELLKKQKASRNSEYDKNCEYIHPKTSDLSQSESKKDTSRKDKKKEDVKKKDNKKDGKSTDDERKTKKPANFKNYQQNQRNRSCSHDQTIPPLFPTPYGREPPPPYPGGKFDNSRKYQQHTQYNKESEPSLVVKVELNQSGKNQRNPGNRKYLGPAQQTGPYYGQNDYSYQSPLQGPPRGQPYYGPNQYQGPPPNRYEGPAPHHYQGPPRDQVHGPPHGQYYTPAPPQVQYNIPPQGHYYGPPPQGQYQGSVYGQYQEPPHGNQYQGMPQGQGSYQRQTQGPRGQHGFNKKGGSNKRGRSKPRGNDKKSGAEKSSRSSNSDSSD